MDGLEWVIDTGVVRTASEPAQPNCWAAVSLLALVLNNHHIAVDAKGAIQGEYEKNLKHLSHGRVWLTEMIVRNKIMFRDGQLPSRHVSGLVDGLKFHRDDLPFVAVAHNGTSKFLVSKDSDYTTEVAEYLLKHLGISTFTIEAAAAKASQPAP